MSEQQYTEKELLHLEGLLSTSEENVWAGLQLIGPGLLPERLTIALYHVMRFYDDAQLVGNAYDVLVKQAPEPFRSLVKQYSLLRQPDTGGDETTRKTLYAYIEEEAGFDAQLYVQGIIRIMRFFCERALNSLKDIMQDMGMDSEALTFIEPFLNEDGELDLTLNEEEWASLDLDLALSPFTVSNETAYLNANNREDQYNSWDFTGQSVTQLQIYPSSVLVDLNTPSAALAGIHTITLVENDRPLSLPEDLHEAPDLTTLVFQNIAQVTPQAWEVFQNSPNIQHFEWTLPPQMIYPHEALFELQQITVLTLGGPHLKLDFPLVLMGNLRVLHLSASSLEGSHAFFRQLDTLHHLDTLTLHPALEMAYRRYQEQRD